MRTGRSREDKRRADRYEDRSAAARHEDLFVLGSDQSDQTTRYEISGERAERCCDVPQSECTARSAGPREARAVFEDVFRGSRRGWSDYRGKDSVKFRRNVLLEELDAASSYETKTGDVRSFSGLPNLSDDATSSWRWRGIFSLKAVRVPLASTFYSKKNTILFCLSQR